MSFSGYFAITSNTVQFGARIDLFAKKGPFSVEGFLLFAGLFQFSPFYFRTFMEGSLSVKKGSKQLMGVDVGLFLEGPTPWHARGKIKFKVLFVEVDAGFDVTFGSEKEQRYLPADPWDPLLDEIRNIENWHSVGGHVEIIQSEGKKPEKVLIIPPNATLEIRQRLLPFGIEIQKVGNIPTPKPMVFNLEVDTNSSAGWTSFDLKDYFSLSQFQNRSAAQRLGDQSFELQKNGLRLENKRRQFGRIVTVPVRYEIKTLGKKGQDPSFAPAPSKRASFSQGARHLALASMHRPFQTGNGRNVFSIIKPSPIRRKHSGFVVLNPKTGSIKSIAYASRAESEAVLMNLVEKYSGDLEIFPTPETNR